MIIFARTGFGEPPIKSLRPVRPSVWQESGVWWCHTLRPLISHLSSSVCVRIHTYIPSYTPHVLLSVCFFRLFDKFSWASARVDLNFCRAHFGNSSEPFFFLGCCGHHGEVGASRPPVPSWVHESVLSRGDDEPLPKDSGKHFFVNFFHTWPRVLVGCFGNAAGPCSTPSRG